MKHFVAIILGIWLVALPTVPYFAVGLFRRDMGLFPTAIICLLALIFVLIPLLVRKQKIAAEQKINISAIDALFALGVLYALARAFAQDIETIEELTILRWTMVVVVYVAIRVIGQKHIILGALVASSLLQAGIAIAQKIGYIESNHSMFDVTGSFGNPGQLAGYLAIGLVVTVMLCVNAIKQRKAILSSLYVIACVTIATALYFADSRASLVAVIVGLSVALYSEIWSAAKRHIRIVMPVAIVAMAILAAVLFNYRPASANARLLVWRVSGDMIADSPVFGHGIGSFNREYMLYQAEYFAHNPQSQFAAVADNVAYPYNELLHIAIELGMVGLLIALAIIALLLLCRTDNKEQRIVKGAFATLIAFSMFSYPSYILPLLIMFPLLTAMGESKPLFSIRPNKIAIVAIQLICIALIVIFSNSMLFYNKASKEAMGIFRNHTALSHNIIVRLLPNVDFGNLYASYLGANHDKFTDSIIGYLPPTCETYCDLGDIFSERGDYTKAKQYYRTASHMIPTRLKPTYALWQMYLTKGDTTSAVAMAKHILSQPLKVESTYTLRAKVEVQLFLQDHDNQQSRPKSR